MVRTLRIPIADVDGLSERQLSDLRKWFVRGLTRMVNLDHYEVYPQTISATPRVIGALCTITSIKHIEFVLPSREDIGGLSQLATLKTIDPRLPNLQSLVLYIPTVPGEYQRFCRRLIQTQKSHLVHISFKAPVASPSVLDDILWDADTIPGLTSLLISAIRFDPKSLWRIPNLRKLELSCNYSARFNTEIPPDALTHLEEYKGPSCFLKGIFSSRRPVSILELDPGALKFTQETFAFLNRGSYDMAMVRPTWRVLLSNISNIPKSGGPVRICSLHISTVQFAELSKAAPFLKTLESLTIYLQTEPRDVSSFFPLV
ncbi:hypothetical protein NLI96_g666 [Meripilus lineatus]|uniref:Uncharacterized protein n=1 Tax=Meripilus lineatus TaxID=2056292 RepID=A0AAD5VBX5_9APHY|nr:hypothetical protein NLI96_g666 [Physisporinus lineatus]